MRGYFRTPLSALSGKSDSEIIGTLASASAIDGFATLQSDAIEAWEKQLPPLRTMAATLAASEPQSAEWTLLLEYTIPRRQKRIDAVLLAGELIFAIEFKTADRNFTFGAQKQVEDYALDLRDFHAATRGRLVIPVLVAMRAADPATPYDSSGEDPVRRVALTNGTVLGPTILRAYRELHAVGASSIDADKWEAAPYRPVPTIIEATRAIFGGHDIREIAQSEAGSTNLTRTSERLISIVRESRANCWKSICFVTGVPGAGKTLAGLNVAHTAALHDGGLANAVFLSGNGPLVKVVSAAIQRDARGRRVAEAQRASNAFIQNVHTFVRTEMPRENQPPTEHVIIFDEAQRAWDADHNLRKTKQDISEPEMLLSIADRHDWSVVVALVGGGQEINTGEAGLREWGRTLRDRLPHWRVFVSPEALTGGMSLSGHSLFENPSSVSLTVIPEPALHLHVNIRSYRTERLTKWVEAVLAGSPSEATAHAAELAKKFPLALTRSLTTAREWLRAKTRGQRRCGLLASSGASRLRPDGLELSSGFRLGNRDMFVNWFLNEPPDIRSSNQLEIAASEYECQGLELDWTGVCWGGDFTFDAASDNWSYRHFSGKRWGDVRRQDDRQYILNTYRVLITRAREGLVIWIPRGEASDETRPPKWFDETAEYLRSCGLPEI